MKYLLCIVVFPCMNTYSVHYESPMNMTCFDRSTLQLFLNNQAGQFTASDINNIKLFQWKEKGQKGAMNSLSRLEDLIAINNVLYIVSGHGYNILYY